MGGVNSLYLYCLLPLSGNALHGSAHEWIGFQNSIKMINREREHVAVRFSAHTCRSARVSEQTNLSEVRTIRQRGCNFSIAGYNIDYSFLNTICSFIISVFKLVLKRLNRIIKIMSNLNSWKSISM